MAKQIPEAVMAVLSECVAEANVLKLPPRQLPRPDYEAINKVIQLMGGKWNRSAQGMVFPGNAAEVVDAAILAGEVVDHQQELGFFETPPAVIEVLMVEAEPSRGMAALEPSAGCGAIAMVLEDAYGCDVSCVEVDAQRASRLADLGFRTLHQDFLTCTPDQLTPAELIVMNPPFMRQEDIAHVRHAYEFLAPGGRLVSVMGAGVTFRQDRRPRAFRDWLQSLGGRIEKLPVGSFKPSGTGVNTCFVVVDKPEGAG